MLAWWWLGCGGSDGDGPVVDHTALVDADGDGFAADEDCDDDDFFVHPGAPDEPYDGVDSDCAGDDDDDADGDGHRAEAQGGDDCNDLDGDVSPSAAEAPYDGRDNDCDPATPDDDLDGDGFRAFEECDDADGTAFPGAIEIAFDGRDQDCDGTVDAMPFGRADWGFVRPGVPRALDTPHGVVVAVIADQLVPPAPATPVDSALAAVPIAHDVRGSAPLPDPTTVLWGRADTNPIRDVALAPRGTDLHVGLAWPAGNGYGYLAALPVDWITGVGWFAGTPSYTEDVFQDHTAVDAWMDGGDALVVGGGAAGVGWVRGTATLLADGATDPARPGGVATFRDPGAPDTFVSCDGAACVSLTFDPSAGGPPVAAPAQPWAGRTVAFGRSRGDAVVWSDGVAGLRWTDGTRDAVVRDDVLVTEGDLAVADGILYGALVVDGELRLVRGPLAGPFDEVVQPLVDTDGAEYHPVAASLVVRPDGLVVAVSALEGSGATGVDALLYAVFAR